MSDEIPQEQGNNRELAVGYASPPANSQFKPGRSANPGGRPKGTSIVAAVRRRAAEIEEKSGIPYADAVARALFEEALAGNVQAIKEVIDRVDGKAPQALEVSGPGGESLVGSFAVLREIILEVVGDDPEKRAQAAERLANAIARQRRLTADSGDD